MGAMGGMLGMGGGSGGTGVSGPTGAPIEATTNGGQIATAYNGTQDALAQQKALLEALQTQNGIQNQSNVYNQMQGIANGTGPNPARDMFNQATAANVANQAALMAGQRGAGANVGLMARQAGMQGGNIQQQAAGQGATLQSNQALNALGAMGNISGQQVANQMNATQANNAARQNEQQMLINAQQGYNTNQVQNQNSVNSANATMASGRAGQQPGAIGGLMNAAGPVLGNFFKTLGAAGGGLAGMGSSGMLSAGAGDAITTGGVAAGGMAAESAPIMMAAAEGGMIDKSAPLGPKSSFARHILNPNPPRMAEGGKVPALVAPGERYLPPSEVKAVAAGKKAPMQAGEKIQGTPKVGGAKNSYANDTVPKTLQEGGIVLPRSVTQSKDPAKKAAEFVSAILKRDALKKGKK